MGFTHPTPLDRIAPPWRSPHPLPNYRRATIPGATWFFTVILAGRSSSLPTERIADLRSSFARVRADLPFRCDAAGIPPDHLHMV